MRFEVFTVANMKMTAFWVVAPCSLVEVLLITLMMEAVSTSETSVNFYQTTWCNNLEDSHLQLYLEFKAYHLSLKTGLSKFSSL
jgi:hypothetical protein